MADKQLLSMTFENLSHTVSYNLGCNSPDNMPSSFYHQTFDSNFKSLSQVGCLMYVDPNIDNGLTKYEHIKDIMDNLHYGSRAIFPKDVNGVEFVYDKFYLNGEQYDEDGNPMPHIEFDTRPGKYFAITYYDANGDEVGPVFTFVPGGPVEGGNAPSLICGELYTDGTFTGDYGGITRYNLTSKRRYQWGISGHVENRQIIYQNVIDDLQNYLPLEPEGEWTDSGEGDFDASSDTIDFPGLPSISALDTGMTQIYEMTTTQIRQLSNYLWTTDFYDNIIKMFNDPMESIINLCISPIDLTQGAVTTPIKIGNILTSISGQMLQTPYKIIDFGVINLHEYWSSFADYSPYTKLSIFLPYVGVESISIDDVMNGSIQLKAYCDVLTGSVQYILKSTQGNRRGHGHDSVLYTWGGNFQYQIPLNASNMSSVVSSIISTTGTVAGAIGSTIATGGMTAPIAVGAVGSTISNVMNAKTHVQRGGGIGGAIGLFGVQKPYLILERPEQITPNNYRETIGIPSEKSGYLTNFSGFVKIKGVNLSINRATENELNEIENILKEGVLV